MTNFSKNHSKIRAAGLVIFINLYLKLFYPSLTSGGFGSLPMLSMNSRTVSNHTRRSYYYICIIAQDLYNDNL